MSLSAKPAGTMFKQDQPSRRPPCAVCGAVIPTHGMRTQRTCSRACGYRLRKERTRKQKPCEVCKTLFWPKPKLTRVCSRACYRALVGVRPAMVPATCANCGHAFKRTLGAVTRVTRTFCSRACSQAFHVGENSPMFRGDKDPNRGAAWNKLAEAIRRRDGFSCRRCGKCQGGELTKLSVDHVRPWRSFEDKDAANHPDNLVSLCRSCHAHKTSAVERAWLKGDVIAFNQWVRSLHLESATKGIAVAQDAKGEWRITFQQSLGAM